MALSKAAITTGVGFAVASGLVAAGAIVKARRKKAAKRKSVRKASRKRNYRRYKRKQKQPHTAGKRKDTSHRRIKYTKNNQPYIILKSGKARFIKKSSVRNSRKRKGGRY